MIVSNGVLHRPASETRAGMMAQWPNGWGWNDPAAIPPPGMYSQQRAGVPVTTHTALQIDTVFTAIRVLTNSIIKMGNPRAFQWAYHSDNRPYRVWMNPQPGILTNTWGGLFQFDGTTRTVASMAMFGEAFWFVMTRDYLQRPTALEVLNPAFVEVKKNKSTGAIEYWYGTGSTKVQIDNDDLIHIPFVAMPGATRGLNSIEYAGVSYALALAAIEYGQRWFAQGASPSYLLSTDQKLGQEEVRRIAEKFLVEHSGLASAHLPLVVDSGLKVDKIQSTPDEAQYLNTLEYARSCIAAYFGLPSHLVGGQNDKGNVWGKTVQEQGFQLVDFTLSGYVVRLDEAYSSLLPRGTNTSLDEHAILRADAVSRAAEITAGRTTGVDTINDLRLAEKRPPVPGGDDPAMPLNSNTSPPVGQVMATDLAKAEGVPAPVAPAPAA